MDFISFIMSAEIREISATAVLVGVVVLIITGGLIPKRTHDREMKAAGERIAASDAASAKKDEAINLLVGQNSNLLAGVRIADKFYRDFMPAPDENTIPRSEVPHVG